jgi:hypothetical protein
VRDGRGRFASTPGGGAKKAKPKPGGFRQRQAVKLVKQRGQLGVLGAPAKAAKARVKATKARTGLGASPQQRGALTRAKNTAGALSGRRKLPAARPSGVLAKGTKAKPAAGSRVKPSRPGQQSADQAPKQPKQKRSPAGQAQPKKGGKKVDVQIKRAAAGGEYGPDGHFYPAGAWMPAGKFVGAKQQPKGNGDPSANGKGKDGGDRAPRVIRQKEPDPPIIKPTGKAVAAPANISPRGEKNRDNLFGSDGYIAVDKQGVRGFGKDGFGFGHVAAVAARLTAKQMGKAVLKLRNMAKDKAAFDDSMNYSRNSYPNGKAWQERQGVEEKWWYDRMRREGLLPRGAKLGQFRRAEQLINAVAAIGSQRAGRSRNRRTSAQEFAWVFNNLLGSRAPRKPSRRPVARADKNGAPRRIRGPGVRGSFRPISTANLVAAGGSRWQKDKFDRVYFNQPNTGKVFFDRTTRKMVNQSGDKRGAALAARMLRAGRRRPAKPWRTGRIAAKP